MIPSRGLRWSSQAVGLSRRRLEELSARSFSSSATNKSLSRSVSQLPRSGTLSTRTFSRPRFLGASSIIFNGAAIRLKSTSAVDNSPLTTSIAESSTSKTPAWTATPSELPVENTLDTSTISLLDIPEHIGYLKELGLDYGWGPTAIMEWVLEHVHVFAGTPWWASIAVTAFIVRAAMFYPYVMAADNGARMATVMPMTKPLTKKMTALNREGKTMEMMVVRLEIKKINKRAGVKLWKSLVPIAQVFAGYGTFVLLRGMGNLPVPGFETGGFLWIQNLAIPDPNYLFPLMTAGVLHMVLRKGGETGVSTMSPTTMKAMAYGLPVVTVMFTWWLPAALQLSFFVSGVLSAVQSTVFRQEWFRKLFKMTPNPQRPDPFAVAEEPSPYQPRVVTVPKESYRDVKGSYEPPRSGNANAYMAPDAKTTAFAGLRKEARDAVASVQETGKSAVKSMQKFTGQSREGGKMTKQELKEAEAYEKKRAFEDERKLKFLADQKRAARRAKKQE